METPIRCSRDLNSGVAGSALIVGRGHSADQRLDREVKLRQSNCV